MLLTEGTCAGSRPNPSLTTSSVWWSMVRTLLALSSWKSSVVSTCVSVIVSVWCVLKRWGRGSKKARQRSGMRARQSRREKCMADGSSDRSGDDVSQLPRKGGDAGHAVRQLVGSNWRDATEVRYYLYSYDSHVYYCVSVNVRRTEGYYMCMHTYTKNTW
jgi:hypothetical protein